MLATPHMLAGVAIGMAIHRPELALPLAFASHFALDALPHVDGHTLFGKPQGGPTLPEILFSLLDVLVGVMVICLLVHWGGGHSWWLLAAFAGAGIDLFDNVPGIRGWFRACVWTSWLSALHHACHNDMPLFSLRRQGDLAQ